MQPGANPVVASASAGEASRAGEAPQWCSSSGRLMRSHPRAMTSNAESPTMKTSDLSTRLSSGSPSVDAASAVVWSGP